MHESNRRKIVDPKFAALSSFWENGQVLMTVNGLRREGIELGHYERFADNNDYTILVYMIAGEAESTYGAASEAIRQMQNALKKYKNEEENVLIVVEAGGTTDWQQDDIDGYYRFCITSDGITDMLELDTRNMGRSDTFTDFLNYGTQTYPSYKYGVVIWDSRTDQEKGFGSDSNYQDDFLTLSELCDGFHNMDNKYDKFKVIHLNAEMKEYTSEHFIDAYKVFVENNEAVLQKKEQVELEESATEVDKIIVDIDPKMIKDIVAAYLVTFCTTESDHEIYLINSNSDVIIDNGGYLKAILEMDLWGIQGQPLCMIETLHTDEVTVYLAPILFNQERCNMEIEFTEDTPEGKIVSIVSVQNRRQEYEISEGDIVTPLYPVEQTDKANSSDEPAYERYDADYYRGEDITINSLEEGDAELELIRLQRKNILYGFMIEDKMQKLYYTDIVE